ncbi:MAG: hypothetical protein KFF77_05765 [Bacteroidetes bacterium]|nr:hypothetical protein [Bacteroidota bacterium]
MKLFERHSLDFYRSDCRMREAQSDDVRYSLIRADDFPWNRHPATHHFATYRKRFQDGGRAMIGEIGGTVVFTAWLACSALRIDELRCTWRLPDGCAVVYDVVTESAWRGRGIYPEALRRIGTALAKEGKRHFWIYAEADNASSRSGIKKAGFEQAGRVNACIVVGVAFRSGDLDRIPGLAHGFSRLFHQRRAS